MLSYDYLYEKLLGATEIMATGKGSRPCRLELATVSYLIGLSPEHVPEELRSELREFLQGMSSKDDPNQGEVYAMGKIWHTARHMHWKTAERLSKLLFSMFLTVSEFKQKSKHKSCWGTQ